MWLLSSRHGSSEQSRSQGDGQWQTAVSQRFPSWQEHGGVAILFVGLLNGAIVVGGFGITWLVQLKRYELDCQAQRLKSELERTERQLEALFGPLRAITHATEVGYSSFVQGHCGERTPLQLEAQIRTHPRCREARVYRQLVSCTLQPLNRRVMETVLSNTHLIDGEFPKCLYNLYSHVIEMDLLLERWGHSDFASMFPPMQYPGEVNRWADEEFMRLRRKQKNILAELGQLEFKQERMQT